MVDVFLSFIIYKDYRKKSIHDFSVFLERPIVEHGEIHAAPENIQKSSVAFNFVQAGVLQQYFHSSDGSYFSYKKLANGKQGMVFSWSSRQFHQDGQSFHIQHFGPVAQIFCCDLPTKKHYLEYASVKDSEWCDFAVFNYGSFEKNAKIMY